jgi:hypothetical protein
MDLGKIIPFPLMLLGVFQYLFKTIKIGEVRAWALCFTIIGIISTICGTIFFPQTLKDSFSACISYFFVLSVLPFITSIRYSKISLHSFTKLIVALGWVFLGLKTLMFVLGVQYNYVSIFTGIPVELTGKKWPTEFITVCMIYYFFRFLKHKNVVYLGYSFLFLVLSNVFLIQREEFALEFFMLILILFKDFKRNAASIFSFIVIVLVLIMFATSFFADNLEPLIAHFTESLKIFGSASKIQDNSAGARVDEFVYFMQRITDSPIFGTGIPRESLKQTLFIGQQSFNIGDMGVFGIYIGSGIVGVLVYIVQLRYVYKLYKRIKNNGIMVNTLYFYLVYVTIYSVGTAKSFLYPAHFLAVVVLILYFKQKEDKIKAAEAEEAEDAEPEPDIHPPQLVTS